MYPVHKGNGLFPCHPGGGFIGKEHELLDQQFTAASGSGLYIHTDPILVEDQLAFRRIQGGRPPPIPIRQPLVRQLVHQQQGFRHLCILFCNFRSLGTCQNGVDFLIYPLDPGTDHGLVEGVGTELPLLVQIHNGGKGEPILPRIQRADAVGQGLGQHGDHLVRIIHTGAPVQCLHIQGGISPHIVGYVRNVYPQPVALSPALDGYSVVQILGFCRIDGEDALLP